MQEAEAWILITIADKIHEHSSQELQSHELTKYLFFIPFIYLIEKALDNLANLIIWFPEHAGILRTYNSTLKLTLHRQSRQNDILSTR